MYNIILAPSINTLRLIVSLFVFIYIYINYLIINLRKGLMKGKEDIINRSLYSINIKAK